MLGSCPDEKVITVLACRNQFETSWIKFDTSNAALGRQNPDQTLIQAFRPSALADRL